MDPGSDSFHPSSFESLRTPCCARLLRMRSLILHTPENGIRLRSDDAEYFAIHSIILALVRGSLWAVRGKHRARHQLLGGRRRRYCWICGRSIVVLGLVEALDGGARFHPGIDEGQSISGPLLGRLCGE